jgi:dolichol-phosphate mannosyltransferase
LQLTIVIPTYNEAQSLPRLVEAIFSLPLPGIEILVVDDASPDGTAQIAENIALSYSKRINVLKRSSKMGLGTAYIAGFQHALRSGAEAIAQMDADFSHPPQKLLEMAAGLESVDVVMGSRYIPEAWISIGHCGEGFIHFWKLLCPIDLTLAHS